MRRFAAIALAVSLLPCSTFGQGGQGGNGGGGQGGGPGGGGGNNQPAGIAIDPNGVVSNLQFKAPSTKLARKHREALAAANLPADLNSWSDLRCVSLVKLEARLREVVAAKLEIPVELKYLAGLQRIDYVFVFPEQGDLVLAGPGEGFAPGPSGRPLGTQSARPPLRLDDLLVALRVVAKAGQLGCSIDPVPARLAQTQQWINANSQPANTAVAKARYEKMAEILGLQNVTVWGLPEDSHLAQVFVEADFRMKQLVMGLENPRVRGFKSHLAMLRPGGNSLRRWWFTPLYDEFELNDDHTAWHFAGPRAQLLSQEEYTNGAGERFDSAQKLISAEKFAQQFSRLFPELCKNVAVFAELQNAFDLTVFAALLTKHRLPARLGWDMSLLMDGERLPTEKLIPAKQIPTSSNCKRHSGRLVLGIIGGGVVITPRQTFDRLKMKPTAEVEQKRVAALQSRADHWWWDAAIPPETNNKTKQTKDNRKANTQRD